MSDELLKQMYVNGKRKKKMTKEEESFELYRRANLGQTGVGKKISDEELLAARLIMDAKKRKRGEVVGDED